MKKILVIEDNQEVRENLCEILALSNYEVIDAPNGVKGVELAKSNAPDIIICDVMMPELDGFGVLKILNNDAKTFDIPFIFLTAKAEKTDMRKGMGLGADDYITKPFDDTELLEAVEIRLKKAESVQRPFDKTDTGLQRFFSEAKAIDELSRLSDNRELRKLKKKDVIFEEGQNVRWVYFVVEGQVKVFQMNDYGKELITDVLSAGEFFGYHSLLSDTTYGKSAAAMADTTLRLIPKEDFTLLLHNNRDFSAKFIKMLSGRAQKTERQLIELAYSSVRRKVAQAVIEMASKESDDKEGLTVTCSREDLASKAGTAVETLIRTLSDFKSEGMVEIQRSYIKIIDITKMKSLPN